MVPKLSSASMGVHPLWNIVGECDWVHYYHCMCWGVKSGFAGNLSTVSSFVKEIIILSEKNEVGAAYLYATGSAIICCLVGLLVYIPLSSYISF